MGNFVQINGTFIRKDLIEVLEIEMNTKYEEDRYGIMEEIPWDMFIIVNGIEYCIPGEDTDSWFKFIETWYDVDDMSKIRQISGDLCSTIKSRGLKE